MKAKAQIGNATLAYLRQGHGMPLLCLHGGMGVDSGSLHVPGILDLAKENCELVLFDQRGHGESLGSDDPAAYSHQIWANDVLRLAQHFGWKRFALLGHSYGGFIALEYAVRWQQTLSALVLVSTSAGPVSNAARFHPTNQEHLRSCFEKCWPQFFHGADKHWEIFNQLCFSPAPYNAAFETELSGYDLRSKAGAITVPTLLIVGDQDHYVAHMKLLSKTLPNAQLHVFPNVAHFPFVEARDAFVATVSGFLKSIHHEPRTGK